MRMKQSILIWGCLLWSSALLPAAESYNLDLQGSLDIAINRSYKMRTLKENLLQAGYELKAATSRFKTQVDLDLKIPNYTETMRNFEDSLGVHYFPVKQAAYSSNLVIRQPLPTDGSIDLSSGFYTLEDYYRRRNSIQLNTRLRITQPLEAFYSYNRIKSTLRQAQLHFELSRKQLSRSTLDLNYEVGQAFYGLVSANEREKIAEQTLRVQEEAYHLAQNKYKAGVIAEVEALQMEVDYGEAQNSYDIAVANRRSQANYLKQLLGINLADTVRVDYDLSYQVVAVDAEQAVALGLKNRLEIREKEISAELSEIDIRRTRADGRITGSISAYYDFIGIGEDDRNIALSRTFDKTWQNLSDRPGNKGVSLDISIPIWDWGVNRAQVKAAEAGLRKARYTLENEKVSVERDIRDTVTQLKSSLKRLHLLEKNVAVAEKSFEISKNRFSNGDINSQSLALDRNRLSQAYVSRLEAYISYKLLLADLARKTFYDYENDRVL